MSMNICITGSREVVVVKTGKTETQTTNFNCWQTPTKVTRNILKSEDKVQAYKDWVRSIDRTDTVEVFADDDFFCKNGPISTKVVDLGAEHIGDFERWIEWCEGSGYTIEFDDI